MSECSIRSTENGLTRSTDDTGSGRFRGPLPKGLAIVFLGAILTLFGCSEGFVCVDGVCVTEACADIECGPSEECLDGECVPLADCETSLRNACGGCEDLMGTLGAVCGGVCWVLVCVGVDALVCEQQTNACGGCEDLVGAPGDACGEICGSLACDGVDSLICNEGSLNSCGGCRVLSGSPGASCGSCGTLACHGVDSLICNEGSLNSCGGCGVLSGSPGASCGSCGTLVCNGTEALTCDDAGTNACGGCSVLVYAPGNPCGACGVFACSGTDSVVCLDPGPNECGITAIGPPVEYSSVRAAGINNHGHVTGYYHNLDQDGAEVDRHAYVWTSPSQALLLPTLSGNSSGWAINDSGLVSGYSTNADGSRRAVMWDSTLSTIIDVGTLESTPPGNSSYGLGINNQGLMVGYADVAEAPWGALVYHAFCYDQTEGIRDLGTLTSEGAEFSNGYSVAYGVNDLGDIVGIAHAIVSGAWTFLAFIHDDVQGMRALPVDPTTSGGHWTATVINGAGMIGGHWESPTSQLIPYYWANSNATPVRLVMPEQFPNGEIYGINSSGVMVGMMFGEGADAPDRAFAFDVQTGVVDLNDLLHLDTDWILTFARDLNDAGRVVGTGTLGGVKRGFVLDMP